MDPLTVIGAAAATIELAKFSYSQANNALAVVLAAVHFPKEYEFLWVQLKVEQFRLETWGKNAGLEDGGLIEPLHPISAALHILLDHIFVLFHDLDTLQSKFGIGRADSDTEKGQQILAETWRTEIEKLKQVGKKKVKDSGNSPTGSESSQGMVSLSSPEEKFFPPGAFKVTLGKRLWWAVWDKDKFQTCVRTMESYINKLEQLLPERQNLAVRQDWTRINIMIVGKADDEDTIAFLRRAFEGVPTMEPTRNMLQRKAAAKTSEVADLVRGNPVAKLSDYILPRDYSEGKTRFVATSRKRAGEKVLFEKKVWDNKISLRSQPKLEARLSRLVAMLRAGRSPFLPVCLGFATDRPKKCWWLVFKLPNVVEETHAIRDELRAEDNTAEQEGPAAPDNNVSELHHYFSACVAPLERRIRLAHALAVGYSELFSSGWVHKGISSHNAVYFGDSPNLVKPMIVGFEFSRQETEESNVDAARTLEQVKQVLHRHPDYIGAGARRYITGYDIYSFGLVLVEIARWKPIHEMFSWLEGRTVFNAKDAKQLKDEIAHLVEKDFAFNMGTLYADAVAWCLGYANEEAEEDPSWHPALVFNDHVVVPLSKACGDICG